MERSNTQPDEEPKKTIRAGNIDVNGYINSLKRDIEIKDNIIQRLRDYIEELKEEMDDDDEEEEETGEIIVYKKKDKLNI